MASSISVRPLTFIFLIVELGSLSYESNGDYPAKVAKLAKDDALTGIAKAILTQLSTLYGHNVPAVDKTAREFLKRASLGETP
jgi:hypothetical protein